MAFNKHEDGYAAVWKGKTEKAPTPGEEAGEAEREGSVSRAAPCLLSLSSGPALVGRPSRSFSHLQTYSTGSFRSQREAPILPYRPVFSLSLSSANLEGLNIEKPSGSSVTSGPSLTFKQFLR